MFQPLSLPRAARLGKVTGTYTYRRELGLIFSHFSQSKLLLRSKPNHKTPHWHPENRTIKNKPPEGDEIMNLQPQGTVTFWIPEGLYCFCF